MRFFPLFLWLGHRNCLIFGTKVNLDNIYTLTILKLFGQFLIPSNPLLILLKRLKMRFFPLFFWLVHRNCLIFGTKVNLDNTYTFAILKLFEKYLIPSNPLLILLKSLKIRFSPLFFWLVHRNCLIFGTKVNQDNTYTLEIL